MTPLNNADKEALKQRLDALDAQDARRAAVAAGAGGGAGLSGSSSTGSKAGLAAAAAAPAPAAHHSHQSLTNQWLPALHTAQLNKQKQKAEHKRLVEAQARAQQRAALVSGRCCRGWEARAGGPCAGQPTSAGKAEARPLGVTPPGAASCQLASAARHLHTEAAPWEPRRPFVCWEPATIAGPVPPALPKLTSLAFLAGRPVATPRPPRDRSASTWP